MSKPQFPYQRVRRFVLEQIKKGVWKQGEHLPSEVVLAAQMAVHRLTVNRVMRELVNEGLLHRRRGIGTVVGDTSAKANDSPFGEGLVGLVTGHHFNPAKNPYYGEIFHGMSEGLKAEGIYLTPLGDVGEFLETISNTKSRALRKSLTAIALLGPVDRQTYAVLEVINQPVVVVGVAEYRGPMPSVASDDRADAGEVARKILDMGHRRIVHLNAVRPCRLESKLEGFLEACESAGAPVPYRYILEADGLEIEDGRKAMRDFMERGLPFTAVFGGTDHLALGAMAALRESGVHVPDDVSVVGFDGILTHVAAGLPTVCTMSVPRYEMGLKAAATLAALCKGHEFQEHVLLRSTWMSGGTLAAAKSEPAAA